MRITTSATIIVPFPSSKGFILKLTMSKKTFKKAVALALEEGQWVLQATAMGEVIAIPTNIE